MYVRTEYEQQEVNDELQVGEHPIWAGAWGGARLDEDPFVAARNKDGYLGNLGRSVVVRPGNSSSGGLSFEQ